MRPIVAAVSLLATSALPPFLAGALAVQMQADLGFGDRGLGLGVAGFFAMAGLSAPLGGRLADRLGWRVGALIGALSGATALLLVAVAVPSLVVFVAVLTTAGTVHGLTGPTSNLIMIEELPSHRHGLAFGVKQAAIPVVTMLAGLSVPTIALTVGWRWAFVGALVVPVVAVIAALGGRPHHSARRRARRRTRTVPRPPLPRAVRRSLSWLAVAGGLGTISVGALGTFTVRTAVEAGLSAGAAGTLVALGSLAGLATRVSAGWVADHRGVRRFTPVATLMTGGAVGFTLLATGRPLLVGIGAVLAFGAGWGWAGLFILGVVHLHPEAPGAATGVAQVGTAGGAAVGPLAFGIAVSHLGYDATWLIVAGITVLAVVVLLGAQAAHRRASVAGTSPTANTAGTGILPR